MREITLSLPGYGQIVGPSGIPSGGFFPTGQNILQVAVQLLLIFTVVLALIFLIWGGIQWILSGGDKQKLEQARGRLTYAIIGLVIALLAIFIVNLIGEALGVGLLGKPPSPQKLHCDSWQRWNPETKNCEP